MSLSSLNLLRVTCNALRGNFLRSCLSTFGVFMGVAAVNATLQVSNISRGVIQKQLDQRVAPQVETGVWGSRRRLTLGDVEVLEKELNGIKAINPRTWGTWRPVTFQEQSQRVGIRAVSQNFLVTSGRKIQQGRFFYPSDFANYRPVAIVDTFLAEYLFKGKNPIGEKVYADKKPYIVVGVMDTKLRYEGSEPRGEMVIPLSFHMAVTGRRTVDYLEIRPEKLEDMTLLEEEVQQRLQKRFPDGNVWVEQNADDILQQQQTLKTASLGLLGVGAVALLVAGVGIANITIASVMERTKEIGLRRALGATRRDIMMQFILEAVLMSVIGGVGAIVMVDSLTRVVAKQFDLPYNFETNTATLSLSAAILVGVGSSLIPAMRASKLDPVKALRGE